MLFILESALTGLALSMDAFAVSLCIGASVVQTTKGTALRMGAACGLFQFGMPLLGWLLGAYCVSYIAAFDHWIAFALLALVGCNMIRESCSGNEQLEDKPDPTQSITLLYLALATSIDALAVGASFAMINSPVWWLSVISGVMTALLCFYGVKMGHSIGCKFGEKVELLGGVLLCLIGLNILRSHIWG